MMVLRSAPPDSWFRYLDLVLPVYMNSVEPETLSFLRNVIISDPNILFDSVICIFTIRILTIIICTFRSIYLFYYEGGSSRIVFPISENLTEFPAPLLRCPVESPPFPSNGVPYFRIDDLTRIFV